MWPAYQTAHKHLIDTTRSENNEYPLIYFEAPDPTSTEKTSKLKIDTWKDTANYVDHLSLRKEEFSAENQYGWAMENGKNNTEVRFTIIYSTKAYAEIESLLNLFKTLFICCVLGIAAHYFTKDASHLVLEPLERMIEKVQLIAKNPLAAATD